MQDYMGGSKGPADKKVPQSAQDDDSDEESSMITRDTAKEEDLICSKSSNNSVTNRFSDMPKLDEHNEADDIADKIEETLLSYADAEPLDTDSLPKPMFGGEPDHHEEAPKFGAFQGDSEDDGMPMAS
jgi:hypothetical protein